MENRISGRTGVLALIGSPVGHSGSPAMYNYSFKRLGLDYVYVAFDVKKEQVAAAVDAVRTFGLRGCNVTMPCKTEIVTYMDALSPAARMCGAVNTVVNDDGRLTGHMTDGEGFVNNLRDHGIDVAGRRVVIAGSGGAATAIQVQCALDGVRELVIFNRTVEKAEQTAERIRAEVPSCTVRVHDIADTDTLTREIRGCEIFINGTSVGMAPEDGETVVKDTGAFYPGLVVADIVYHPKETRLLREARAAGCTCVGGKGMLLWQGVSAFRLYTGQEMPVEEVKARFFGD